MGDQGSYEQVGSASDVQNINPYTQNTFNTMEDMMTQGRAGMQGVAGDIQSLQYDPEKALNMFMERIPELQGLVSESVKPMQMAGEDWAQAAADNARQDIAQQYAGQGGLYSGGFGQAVGQGMVEPYLQANQQSQQLQAQMAQNLYGQTMDQLAQQYAQGKQMDLQGLQAAGDMYTQQMATGGQGMAQLGAPEYWQPQYVYQEDPNVAGNALAGGVMGLATGGVPGALMGAAGGGLGAAFGQQGAGSQYGYAGGQLGSGLGAGPTDDGFNWMGQTADWFGGGGSGQAPPLGQVSGSIPEGGFIPGSNTAGSTPMLGELTSNQQWPFSVGSSGQWGGPYNAPQSGYYPDMNQQFNPFQFSY